MVRLRVVLWVVTSIVCGSLWVTGGCGGGSPPSGDAHTRSDLHTFAAVHGHAGPHWYPRSYAYADRDTRIGGHSYACRQPHTDR